MADNRHYLLKFGFTSSKVDSLKRKTTVNNDIKTKYEKKKTRQFLSSWSNEFPGFVEERPKTAAAGCLTTTQPE